MAQKATSPFRSMRERKRSNSTRNEAHEASSSGLTIGPNRCKVTFGEVASTLMQRLRSLSRFSRGLVILFLIAQFAGAAPSPVGDATAEVVAAGHTAHHRFVDTGQPGFHCYGHYCDAAADHCCALHAYFAGVLPPPVALQPVEFTGQRLADMLGDIGLGFVPGPLDRPPRPMV